MLIYLVCLPAGGQKPRGPVYPADGAAPDSAAKDHKAGGSSGEKPRRGGDPAAGRSGPRLWSCHTARFGLKKTTYSVICSSGMMHDNG